jgi:hypothetical protein
MIGYHRRQLHFLFGFTAIVSEFGVVLFGFAAHSWDIEGWHLGNWVRLEVYGDVVEWKSKSHFCSTEIVVSCGADFGAAGLL